MNISDKFHEEIFIFGAGQLGKSLGKCLKSFGLLVGGSYYRQTGSFNYCEIFNMVDFGYVVIALKSKEVAYGIVKMLEEKIMLDKRRQEDLSTYFFCLRMVYILIVDGIRGEISMKWNNKGHELDKLAVTIPKGFREKVYIFGAGEIGKATGLCLAEFGLLGGFIDNNCKRHGSTYLNRHIMSLEEYLSFTDHPSIVIAASQKNKVDIEQQLLGKNLFHGRDYYLNDEFNDEILPIIATYYFDKTYMHIAQITLTERCSLKCKKCAHACYNVDSTSEDMQLSEVYKSADTFFSKVDFINEFVLIGGEPLLYKELSEAITYIGERYRSKMGIYCITTNGTIVPSKEVLQACRHYNVLFRISNYVKAIPRLRESHKKLIEALEQYDIEYRLAPEDGNWIDYGFDYLDKDMDETELIQTFDHCLTHCREIRGNKLYYCVMARSVSDNLHLNEGKNDYLDLEKLNGENYKKELLEFNLGYSEKGYLDMCHRCHGMDAEKYSIPVAEQKIL